MTRTWQQVLETADELGVDPFSAEGRRKIDEVSVSEQPVEKKVAAPKVKERPKTVAEAPKAKSRK